MPSKRQLIQEIVTNFADYAIAQKFPCFDDQAKVDAFLQEYDTTYIVGLVKKYLLGPYNQGKDMLKLYLEIEFARLKVLQMMSGENQQLLEFEPTTEHKEKLLDDIIRIIEIINA